eukprot:GILI01028562.1.p1 GENE.GILI01028562.1~~GILI01028562.1.p1  ORF type:complete len:312 (-),score=47.45 GILI01028562.1:81-971(-)
MIEDILPIPDIHKTNDCDLIYRFLIAKKWDTKITAQAIRDYVKWRKDERIDELLWETFPADTDALNCVYKGFDREGHPVYFDRPDPKVLGVLLVAHPKELLMRVHLRSMEQGRRLQKMYGVDRVTCVIDFNMMSMSMVTNPSAMRFMKALAHEDQTMYPENMRFMLICNGGWTFSAAYKMIKPILDPRVQQKIHFMGGKEALYTDLGKFIEACNLPTEFRGTHNGEHLLDIPVLLKLPKGTAPSVLASAAASAAHRNPDNFLIDDSGIAAGSPNIADFGEKPSGAAEDLDIDIDEL